MKLLSRVIGLVWYIKGGRNGISVINDQLQFALVATAPGLCLGQWRTENTFWSLAAGFAMTEQENY